MNEDQIKYMANRFLSWKLPADFRPDGGVTFDRVGNLGTEHQYYREPFGTNLLNYTQAEAMVRHMVAGFPATDAVESESADRGVVAQAIERIKARFNPHYGIDGATDSRQLADDCRTLIAAMNGETT